jgi:hypothetical protein
MNDKSQAILTHKFIIYNSLFIVENNIFELGQVCFTPFSGYPLSINIKKNQKLL